MRLFLAFSLALALLLSAVAASATTRRVDELRCGLCGKSSQQDIVTSFSFPFTVDLDFQPAQAALRRMHTHICPHCGWIAGKEFSDPVPNAIRAVFEGREYAEITALPLPEEARFFLHVALLDEAREWWGDAGMAYVAAAALCDPGIRRWEAEMKADKQARKQERERRLRAESEDLEDDNRTESDPPGAGDRDKMKTAHPVSADPALPAVDPALVEAAAVYRARALPLLEKAVLQPSERDDPTGLTYMLVEMHRRAGRFDTAAAYLDRLETLLRKEETWDNRLYAPFVESQQRLIQTKNADRQIMPADDY